MVNITGKADRLASVDFLETRSDDLLAEGDLGLEIHSSRYAIHLRPTPHIAAYI